MTDLAASNPHAAMIRVEPKNASRYAGQRRHDLRIGHQPDYVDADRAHLNRVLVAPPTAAVLRSICEDRRAQRNTRRAMKANASVGMVGLIGFGIEAQALFSAMPVPDQDRAMRLAARLAARRMGTTVVGLVFHGDETAPHAHVTFPAYDRMGQPLTETVGRAVLKGLQDDMAAAFSRYAPGIERGRSRMERLAAGADYAETVNRSVRELHRDLPAEIATKRAEVEAAGAALVDAQARVDEMQGRVDKLAKLERDLTAAETKRLATYEKRLADRQDKALKAEQDAATAKAEVDRLADLAEQARAAAEKAEKDRESAEVAAASILDKAAADAEAARLQSERETAAAQSEVQRAEADAAAIREKAAKDADAVAAAFSALAVQIRAGTITQDERGKIVTADSASLRPGGPVLVETARVILPLVSAAQVAKEEAVADRAVAAAERQEIAGLRQTLIDLVGKVQQFLRRPDVSRHMKAHEDGQSLTRDVLDFLRKPKPAPQPSPAPEKPVEDPDTDGPRGP